MADNYGAATAAPDGVRMETGESAQMYGGDLKGRGKQRHLMNKSAGGGSALTSLLNQPPNKKMTPGMKKLAEMQSTMQKEAIAEQM